MRSITHPLLSLGATLVALLVATLGVVAPAQADSTKPAEGKSYVIGTDTTYAPFEMRDPTSGEMVGIDMDLVNAIAKAQGFTVEVRSLGFDAALQALQANQVDAVIAGMTITDARKQVFDFTDPYFDTGLQFAVPESSTVAGLEDLDGKVVAVKTGTAGADYANSVADQYGFRTTAFGQTSDMIADVTSGNAAAYIEDYPVVAYTIAQGNGMKLLGDKIPNGQYGAAVNKGANPEFVQAFNLGLQSLRDSGEYDTIVGNYLSTEAATQSGFGQMVVDALPALLRGLALTLAATALSIVAALAIGIVCGFAKVGGNAVVRALVTGYVAIFRGTPILVQVFFFYFGLPRATGLTLTAFTAGVLTLSLNAGAYMTEIVRGGIQSIDPGQLEAARSLGLPYLTSMRKVVIPQAIKVMTPSFINQFVISLKDTSLLAVIGFAELTYQGQQIIATNFRSFEMWLLVGAIYFVVIALLTTVSNRIDKKVNA